MGSSTHPLAWDNIIFIDWHLNMDVHASIKAMQWDLHENAEGG